MFTLTKRKDLMPSRMVLAHGARPDVPLSLLNLTVQVQFFNHYLVALIIEVALSVSEVAPLDYEELRSERSCGQGTPVNPVMPTKTPWST